VIRFTFISNRSNRTAIASLLAALEDVVEDPGVSLRVVKGEDPGALDFETSPEVSEVLCLSAMTADAAAAVEMHRRLRQKWGRVFTSVAGGAGPSGDPAEFLRAGIDYCCVGEGEEVVRAVCRSRGRAESLGVVRGLFSLDGGKPVGVKAAPIDLARFKALPERNKFPTYIEIGRGCCWGCSYCQTPQIHGGLERYRSPAQVEGTVARYADFGMRDFRFLLPNALGYLSDAPGVPNCAALEELLARSRAACREGRLFLGSFPSEVRPDYVSEEALAVLREYVSNAGLVIGGESGSEEILARLGRGHGVEATRSAARMALASGFSVSVDLVVGFPGETPLERALTLDLVEELGKTGAVSNMHFFMPLPGTALQGCAPVFLSDEERRRFDRMGQRGILRGKWRRQEATARKLMEKRWRRGPSR
jgi:B12-binding domain/radical SAM domain protein